MKMVAAALAVLFLFIVTLAGCETAQETAAPEGQADAAASYEAYNEEKAKAFESVATVLENEPDLYIELQPKITAAGLADVAVMPIKAIGAADETLFNLEALGYTGIAVARDGEKYVITYKSTDGFEYTQTCLYDASLDAMQSSVTDPGGKETMIFEYIKTTNGYTAQYYFGETAEYPWITAYLGEDASAFGISESSIRPPSLLSSSALGLDYVQKCETYFILKDSNLDIFDNGETLTIKGRQ
jgi:hypothetical protein